MNVPPQDGLLRRRETPGSVDPGVPRDECSSAPFGFQPARGSSPPSEKGPAGPRPSPNHGLRPVFRGRSFTARKLSLSSLLHLRLTNWTYAVTIWQHPARLPPDPGHNRASRACSAFRGGRPESRSRMRLSRHFLPVLKESPSDAQIVSHKLMLRAGLDPADRRGHLRLAAAGPARAPEDRADRARGAGSGRRDRAADADAPVRRPVARIGPLRRLWAGDAAHHRSP